ncbi:hypothetical protein ND920_10050 [Vibrio ordalii]|nr:hypothetical protein [Vibrio ordalii]MCS0351961.1 hypothetical protein [Vibrio ordalii]
MFRIVNFKFLFRVVAVLTTILSLTTYDLISSHFDNGLTIMSISGGIAILLIMVITSNFTARPIWKILKFFIPSLYPDLNGTWEGEITTENKQVIPVRVLIKQSLLETQINIHTETSKSSTLESTPIVEGGEPKLYYMYRSLPKDLSWSPYLGTTIFDVRKVEENKKIKFELSGYYYTDRKTVGRIRFRQTGKDTEKDVSFY